MLLASIVVAVVGVLMMRNLFFCDPSSQLCECCPVWLCCAMNNVCNTEARNLVMSPYVPNVCVVLVECRGLLMPTVLLLGLVKCDA